MNYEDELWKLCEDIKVPSQLRGVIKVVTRYNNVLMFCCRDIWIKTIWCFDVLNNKWYRIIDKPMVALDKHCFIPSGGRYCYYYSDVTFCPSHQRIDLFDLCPAALQTKVQERINVRNMKCSFGYCHEKENLFNVMMPDYLKRIVFCYLNDIPKSFATIFAL